MLLHFGRATFSKQLYVHVHVDVHCILDGSNYVQDCGIWASPLEASLELLFQGGYPQYPLICIPPRMAPFLGPNSLVLHVPAT